MDERDIAEVAEDALVEQLTSELDGVIVEAAPSDPDAYDGRGRQGCCLVRYNGSRDSAPPVDGPPDRRIPSLRSIEFVILVGARSLRTAGHTGSYQLLARARRAVTGFRVVDERTQWPITFYPFADGYLREENGVWWYALRVRSTEFPAI